MQGKIVTLESEKKNENGDGGGDGAGKRESQRKKIQKQNSEVNSKNPLGRKSTLNMYQQLDKIYQ